MKNIVHFNHRGSLNTLKLGYEPLYGGYYICCEDGCGIQRFFEQEPDQQTAIERFKVLVYCNTGRSI